MGISLSDVGKTFGPETFEYTQDDVILYALAIGAQPDELEFVYEKNLKVLPTFAVIPVRGGGLNTSDNLGLDYTKLLHGEQRIELFKPLPPRTKITATNTIDAIYDKGEGKGAVVVSSIEVRDETGDLLYRTIPSIFVRGEGGFGGDRGPTGPKNIPPDRAPDAEVRMKTAANQAQLYRLCGDKNRLHVDPDFAKTAGFEHPILHGLCTYGFVSRAILKTFCNNDPARLKSYEVRFAGVVFPGEEIVTKMWKESDNRIIVQAETGDGRIVISNAAAELN